MAEHQISRLDAIRAFAVTVVLLYHLRVPGFAFGYLGVDLFFMLSGFLMTYTMLKRRRSEGRFNVGLFFVRRARRIIPSLFIVIFITLLLSYALMSPAQLADTVKQGFASQFFMSNVLFVKQAGYFAPENEVRALLHTWSLSLEEQFYLFFALLMLLGNRFNFTVLCIVAAALGLVFLAVAYFELFIPSIRFGALKNIWSLEAAIFYLPPFRMVQFMGGALIALAVVDRSVALPNWLHLLGWVIPVVGFILLQMVPVAANFSAILIIVGFGLLFIENPRLSKLGAVPAIKFVAQISYQIYLTHWPIIVFWRYWTFRELNAGEIVLVAVLSVITGWALSHLTRYLTSSAFPVKLVLVGLSSIFVASLGLEAVGRYTKGAQWRIPEARMFGNLAKMRGQESSYCGGTDTVNGILLGARAGEPLVTCTRKRPDPNTIYIIGDSHARHLLPGLSEAFPDYNIKIMYFTSCPPQSGILEWVYGNEGHEALAEACSERNKRMLVFFQSIRPTNIIIHQFSGYKGDNSGEWLRSAAFLINRLKAKGHKVTWLGSVLRPNILQTDCYMVPFVYSNARLARRCEGSRKTINTIFKKNIMLSKRFPDTYVNVNSFFCSGKKLVSCSTIHNDLPLFRDKSHLTVSASIQFVNMFKNSIVLKASRQATIEP